jgi:DNA-binding response OmpR family regulator
MPCRLLIIDDEPAIGFAVTEYLSTRGYRVDRAGGMAEAEDLLARARYALVITDLSLRGREGREGLALAEAVRRRNPGTRTIILTAYGSGDAEAKAAALGVDAFLHKPTRLAELARIVDALVRASPPACGPQEPPPAPAEHGRPSLPRPRTPTGGP